MHRTLGLLWGRRFSDIGGHWRWTLKEEVNRVDFNSLNTDTFVAQMGPVHKSIYHLQILCIK